MKKFLTILVFVGIVLLPAVSYSLPDAVLMLPLDDGEAEDISGNGNNGELEGDPSVVEGKFGDALEFQNSRVKVMASDSLTAELFAEGQFTLVLWINATRVGNAWQQVFRAGPDPNDTLFLNNNGTLSWRGWVGNAWAGGMCETAAETIPAETWTHVAIVSDGGNFQAYVDGELVQESAFQETRANNAEFMIGGYAGGESYSGAVDELAIFAEPLSEADINAIMDKGLVDAAAVEFYDKMTTKWAAVKANI